MKTNNAKLVEWMLTLDGLDTAKENGKGLNAMAVAKAIGRENLLLGVATCDDGPSGGVDAREKSAASAADPNAPPLPPDMAAADEAAMEVARLRTAMKMLKVMARRDCKQEASTSCAGNAVHVDASEFRRLRSCLLFCPQTTDVFLYQGVFLSVQHLFVLQMFAH